MLQWGSAERPQCVLQTLRQCHKALPTEHDVSMLPPREGQAEVIEPVIQRHTGDADAVIAHVGEIGKPHPARRVLLPEDDVLLGPVQCPPGTDAPLQGAANTDADLGMGTPDLVENGHRPQAWWRSSTKALPRCPKPQTADRAVGGRAALAFATAAEDPVRYDRRWRR